MKMPCMHSEEILVRPSRADVQSQLSFWNCCFYNNM